MSASTLRNGEGDWGLSGLPVLVQLAGALGVPVERFAEGMEDPAELGAVPGPIPTKKGRAGKRLGAPEKPEGRGTRKPWRA